MSRRLRTPESRTRYHMPTNPDPAWPTSPTGVNGPIGTDASPTPPLVYLPPYWKISMIRKPSSRLLFGDSRNTFLDPSLADYAAGNPGWDLTVGVSGAGSGVSGDVGRHSAYRWIQYA